MNGDFFPVREAFSAYMARFYAGVYPDTRAMQAFASRGAARSIMWSPDRMIDAAEEMLATYRKNSNAEAGANSLFPVMILSMAKDYTPTGADWGGRQMGRRMVSLVEGGSVYGYRQAMGEIRVQVVIMAAESSTARSLAAQFSLFVAEMQNRRFYCKHNWGQYQFEMPCMLENPDLLFGVVPSDQSNITILASDLTLKMTIPYLDAPKAGEPNDGTANNPPGYPMVTEVVSINNVVNTEADTTSAGTGFGSAAPAKPPK